MSRHFSRKDQNRWLRTAGLGVYLSDDLRWNDHVKTISSKANKTLSFLKRNLIHCPPRTKETAYKALVRPALEYCYYVHMCGIHIQLKTQTRLRLSQRRTARWVLNRFVRKDNVTEMLSTLNWKTLECRRTIVRLSMLYEMRCRLVSHEDAKLQSTGHSFSTRSMEYSYTQPTAIEALLQVFLLRKDNYRTE